MHVVPQAFHPCSESHVAMTDTFQVSPGLIAAANMEEQHGTKGQTRTAVPPSPWQAAISPKRRSGWQMVASIPIGRSVPLLPLAASSRCCHGAQARQLYWWAGESSQPLDCYQGTEPFSRCRPASKEAVVPLMHKVTSFQPLPLCICFLN